MKTKLADSALGAIVTHAEVTENGEYITAAESGFVIYWDVRRESVVFKKEQKNILQVIIYANNRRCMFVSKIGCPWEMKALCIARTVPLGEKLFEFDFPYKQFKKIILSSDEENFIAYGFDKTKETIFVYRAITGEFLHKIQVKYPNFKDVNIVCGLPDKPWQVALIDQDKANIIDVNNKRFVRSILNWGGSYSSDGRYGLYAPSKGGLDLLDLKNGTIVRTLIPKIAEGIFNVICKFNITNEYVMYYHSGRKTIRIFRVVDGSMIANYRVPSELSTLESTSDGNSVVLGMVDGNLTVLTIADPKKGKMSEYLKALPSRNRGKNLLQESGFQSSGPRTQEHL